MAYLGNTTTTAFTSFDKQDLTGSTGTGPFTLTHAVANENELQVFIGNVRQEPTEAYTCSGNQITLTGAVSASDDFYVLFSGKALQTASHPSYLPLAATTGTFSGAVSAASANVTGSITADGLTVDGNAVIDQGANSGNTLSLDRTSASGSLGLFYNGTQGALIDTPSGGGFNFYTGATPTLRMGIDSSGRVTMPYQPSFRVINLPSVSALNTITGGTVSHNIGNHMNTTTGLFTAPVSGRYLFSGAVLTNAANARLELNVLLNGLGTASANSSTGSTAYEGPAVTVVLNLAANDTVGLYLNSGTMYPAHGNSYFSGHLLG